MAETAVGNATAINKKNQRARCYEKLSLFYDKIFHFRRSVQQSSNNQGVISSTEDALLHLTTESGGGEDLADYITPQCFSSFFTDGDIKGDTVLHDAARSADSNAINAILNGGEFCGSKNFNEALCRKRNEFGNTALHEAVMKGHVERVKLLFSIDEVVAHYPNKECKSPLYLAIENRNKEIVDILFPSVSSFLYENIWRQQEHSSISSAAKEGTIERIHEIIRGLTNTEIEKRELEAQENYKAEEILAVEFYKAADRWNVFDLGSMLKESCNKGLYRSDIVNGVNAAGDTMLHLAVRSRTQRMVEFIAFYFPQLLTRRNIKGDTPLHVAASIGSLHNMIIILTCYARHSKNGFYRIGTETLCRIKNECGNTALHEAVMKNHAEGASLLLSADRVVAHFLNKEDKSPLYLAVENDSKELIHVLLHAPFDNVGSHRGKSPLHVAVLKRRSGGFIKKLLAKKPELTQLRDQKGGNPLHYAAFIGHLEGVRTLLEARRLSALERNTKGYLPIHIASKRGHVEVVKEIVEQEWLDPLAMLSLKGQTILHIAAKKGRVRLVGYILREKRLEMLLNEKDKNGNTPLHLASKNLFPQVLFMLTRNKRVKVNFINNQYMTCRDIVLPKMWEGSHRVRVALSSAILFSVRTPTSRKTYHWSRRTLPELKEYWLKERINTLMVVAILVATVTFAAGFTVPGGFISSDGREDPKKIGMAVLVNRRMFQLFTICDAVAMYSSTIASFILLWSRLGDFHTALMADNFALFLVGIALLTMSIAFMASLHLVVASLSWLAWAVIIIGIISISLFLFTFILLVFPLRDNIPILRHISHFLLPILILLSGSHVKLPKKMRKKTKELAKQWLKDKHRGDEPQQVRIDMSDTATLLITRSSP